MSQIDKALQGMMNPLETNRALYSKYSSSQTYYYSNVISEIVKEKRTESNINYEDVEYLCDGEEYLKRFYSEQEFAGKMFAFKEYYFYHEDCPRIYMKHIEDIYSKWQDRRRDLVYKKLKILYNQSLTSSRTSSKDEENPSASGLTHFLLEISDYNPFSKKYYLRVEAKDKQKQKLLLKHNDKNKTVKDLSSLNHDLSLMLNDMTQLSIISTLQQQESPRFSSLYHSKKLKVNYSSQTSTYHNSQSNSNTHSTSKFNFKKNKPSSRQKQKINEQVHKKIQLREKSQDKSIKPQQNPCNYPSRLSPKFADMKTSDQNFKQNYTRSKSIIQLSSFNPNRKSEMALNINLNKKEILKLKTDKKPPSRQSKMNLESKNLKVCESDKKNLVQSQSNKKMPQLIVIEHDKITLQTLQQKPSYQSLGKKASALLTSSNTPLRPIPRKTSLRQELTPVGKEKNNQFSDSKFQKGEIRFRSHKSQYFSLSKQNLLTRGNSPSKISLKATEDKKQPKKDKIQIHIHKKGHQLKLN